MDGLPTFILASASPRRRWLLEQIGLPFRVCPSDVDEEEAVPPGLPPDQLVERLALAKAQDVAGRHGKDRGVLVIGADTVVVLGGRVIGKPADAGEAAQFLARLAGRRHTVYTGLALVDPATSRSSVAHARTHVWMRPLPASWIEAYVATGEPLDKAGAYAVQGLGSVLVERIDGCYFNVVGLPLATLAGMLDAWGIQVPAYWPRV